MSLSSCCIWSSCCNLGSCNCALPTHMAPTAWIGVALQDLYSFCSFSLLIHLAMFLLYASRLAQHPQSSASIIKRVAEALTQAFPIAMPTVIVFSLFCCVIKLLRHGINVHQHVKVKLAAGVEVAVFDKTGTLTGSVVRTLQCGPHLQFWLSCVAHVASKGCTRVFPKCCCKRAVLSLHHSA